MERNPESVAKSVMKQLDRAAQCAEAMVGIPNPAEFVRAARELAIKARNLAHRMQVNELVGKTDSLGLADQKAYDECREAYEALRAAGGGQ